MRSIPSRIVAWLLGALVLAVTVPAVMAGELTAPQLVIRDTATRLRTILVREGARLDRDPAYVFQLADRVLLPHVDMHRVSSLVLGRYWRKADAGQRAAFAREFEQLLVRTYATALRELGDWEISFLPLRLRDGQKDVEVQSRVTRSGAQAVAVDYRMRLSEGRWRAYDVKIEGISLVTNYRSNFAQLIRNKGIDGLINELAVRNAERLRPGGQTVAANIRTR